MGKKKDILPQVKATRKPDPKKQEKAQEQLKDWDTDFIP